MSRLLIVESPNKVKSIRKLLGRDWEVAATSGHIMDLPRKRLGIDLKTFGLAYEYIPDRKSGGRTFPGGKARVDKLRGMVKAADAVYLATDPDREGEAIAAHVKECLKIPDSRCFRVRFEAIDKSTIERAIGEAGGIDTQLVAAQEARRALDRLVGYTVSPLMSRALDQGVSAGRVQSPALRYVVERERVIGNFRSTTHYTALLHFDDKAWKAEWITKPYVTENNPYITDRAFAEAAAGVRSVEVVEAKSGIKGEKPPAPFTTSTLLQAASVKLAFNPETTGKLAQRLFENGHITYHRTDSVNFAPETVETLRRYAADNGYELPEKANHFQSKDGAQEAHEAIRPKAMETVSLEGVEDADMAALYALIHERTLASQLTNARYRANEAILQGIGTNGETFHYKASGRVLIDAGWRSVSGRAAEKDDDPASQSPSGQVPKLEKGVTLVPATTEVAERKTKPPPRYTKASLIKQLEAGGVGRPSTFANIISNIERRQYIEEKSRKLHATSLGMRLIDELLRVGFSFVEPAFTKSMEDKLDEMASGRSAYFDVLCDHYQRLDAESAEFGGMSAATQTGGGQAPPVDEDGNPYPCPICEAPLMRRKIGKGANKGKFFWGCSAWKESGCEGRMDDDNGKPVPRKAAPPATDSDGNPYPCPECGEPLVRRTIGKGPNKGGHFWGCSAWPKTGCSGKMDDDKGVPVAKASSMSPPVDDHGQPFPCPDCGSALLRLAVKKGENAGSHFWKCSTARDTGCAGKMDDDNGVPVPPRGRSSRAQFSLGDRGQSASGE